MKHRKFIGGLALFVFLIAGGCSRKKPDAPSQTATPALQILATGFKDARSIAVISQNDYLVSHLDENGEGVVSRYLKGKVSVLFSRLKNPYGLGVDSRHSRLFLTDGNEVKIYSIKKPEKEPTVITIPTEGTLGDSVYSTMNARAYVFAPAEKALWEIHPKKKTFEKVFTVEEGAPRRMFASLDGVRFYMITKDKLLKINIRKRELSLVKSFDAASDFVGLDFHLLHFVLADSATSSFVGINPRNGNLASSVTGEPDGLKAPIHFVMDLQYALVLRHMEGGGQADLVKFALKLKE